MKTFKCLWGTILSILCLIAIIIFYCRGEGHDIYTVSSVSNPRAEDDISYVVDPSNILERSSIDAINSQLSSLEKETTIESAVVMLPSIGNVSVFDFSQELFRSWGIGSHEKNNGLLIVYVEDLHEIRFHTGYGLEGDLPDAICKRIQMDQMIPLFKEGRTDDAMLAGVKAICKRLSDPKKISDDDTDEEDSTVLIAVICFILILFTLYMGLICNEICILLGNAFAKCPQCGKRGHYKAIRARDIENDDGEYVIVTWKCSCCGFVKNFKRNVAASDVVSNDSFDDAGSTSGGFGGGSTGGGGSSSRW